MERAKNRGAISMIRKWEERIFSNLQLGTHNEKKNNNLTESVMDAVLEEQYVNIPPILY